MDASENSSSAHSSDKSNLYPLRWEGHMANVVGNTVGPEPHAVLSANADEIWFKGTLGDFHIPKSAVTKIGRGGMYPWVFMCVRIRHNIPSIPWLLQFKPMNGAKTRDIIAQLKSLGFRAG